MVLHNHSRDTSVPSFCTYEGTLVFGAGPSVPGVGGPSAPPPCIRACVGLNNPVVLSLLSGRQPSFRYTSPTAMASALRSPPCLGHGLTGPHSPTQNPATRHRLGYVSSLERMRVQIVPSPPPLLNPPPAINVTFQSCGTGL